MFYSEMSDEQLANTIQNGDNKAFEEIYLRFYDFAICLSNKVLHNYQLAEEIAQDSFLKLKEKINTFNYKSKFKSWFHVLVIRLAIDLHRNQKRRKDFLQGIYCDIQNKKTPEEPLEILLKKHEKIRFNQAIEKMPEPYKKMFIMYWLEDCTSIQLSYYYEIPLGTAKTRLRSAMKMFEKEYVNVKEKL